MGGLSFIGIGETTHKALDCLPITWDKIKLKGLLTLRHENKFSERLLFVRPLKRMMANKLRRAQIAKDLEKLLK